AVIDISDTGIGMSETIIERIFEPFFTTKEGGKSAGLGLAMAYGTVRDHNGFIDVFSEPDRGSVFKMFLPV
ncbi:MAG: ATP-binding protein, partial [Candidatus Wallbacteria bacterium]|nr:ATP-binding protein [Candidatus Wallbacteria bacterium]